MPGKLAGMSSTAKKHKDPQTGEEFDLVSESKLSTWAARLTGAYLILSSAAWLWLLFDTWSGNDILIRWIAGRGGIDIKQCVTSPNFRLVAYSMIGGGIGGVLNGFRSLIVWHCELAAFGYRFTWKHVIFPIQGALLGAIVFALLRSGVAMLDGKSASSAVDSAQSLAFFGIGALAGYGAQSVFRWLDYKVSQIFKFPK
jgi:hypothetical protein